MDYTIIEYLSYLKQCFFKKVYWDDAHVRSVFQLLDILCLFLCHTIELVKLVNLYR